MKEEDKCGLCSKEEGGRNVEAMQVYYMILLEIKKLIKIDAKWYFIVGKLGDDEEEEAFVDPAGRLYFGT